jgi:hypothetical protein
MNTLSTLRKRKAEDSPHGGQKPKRSGSMQGIEPSGHPRDRPGKAKGYPYQMHDKTEHPREARRSMQGIEPNSHPRDAPKQKEAHRSMRGIEPSGDPRDAPREVKGAPLLRQVKVEHPREARNSPAGHPRDAPRRMKAQEAHKVDVRHRTRRSSKGCTEGSKGNTCTKAWQNRAS